MGMWEAILSQQGRAELIVQHTPAGSRSVCQNMQRSVYRLWWMQKEKKVNNLILAWTIHTHHHLQSDLGGDGA